MKINHLIIAIFLPISFLLSSKAYSYSQSKIVGQVALVEKINYTVWQELLKENIDEKGSVDYKGFLANKDKFESFLKQLSSAKITSTWTKNDKMAFWINVYNAFTIKLIIDNYPVKSIKSISSPWKQKFFNIDGKDMSLSEVEHKILRGFGDARIHFAINCASASCPPIINEVYKAENLDFLLERQTKRFINNEKYNKISENKIYISKLFDWYKKDFTQHIDGSVIDFINKYSDVKVSKSASRSFLTYDWSINDKK